MPKFQVRIQDIKKLNLNTFEIKLLAKEKISALPGQYIVCRFKTAELNENRTYSIVKIEYLENQSFNDLNNSSQVLTSTEKPFQKNTVITLFVSGSQSGFSYNYFNNPQNLNQEIEIIGPTGKFLVKSETLPKLYIATGTGLAPILFHLEYLAGLGFDNKIKLWVGFKNLNNAFGFDKIIAYKSRLNLEVIICLSQENFENGTDLINKPNLEKADIKIFQGRTTDLLLSNVEKKDLKTSDFLAAEVYLCGNPNMITEITQILGDNNFDLSNLITEKFH